SVANYARNHGYDPAADSLVNSFVDQETMKMDRLIANDGQNNPYEIWKEMGVEMTASCTVVKNEPRLNQARAKIADLRAQYESIKLSDSGMWTNQNLSFSRAVGDMLIYSEAIVEASAARKESRGSHYRDDYPTRNDAQFHKTCKVRWDGEAKKGVIEWEEVPSPIIPPRERNYGKVDAAKDEKKEEKPQAKEETHTAGAS
ncbi:MAG: hypothetical protein AAF750_18145, partial [Planctomycetota bacterium]